MHAFRLANRLHMTVSELLFKMDSVEISEWIAYDRIEDSQTTVQHAVLCALIANVMGNGKKTYTMQDFLPMKPVREAPDLAEKILLFVDLYRGPTKPPVNSFGKMRS